MITLIIGKPGTGKTYEAVNYHIAPALRAGRDVYSNIAINRDAFTESQLSHYNLLTTGRGRERKFIEGRYVEVDVLIQALSTYDELMGLPEGALVVLDECHKSYPLKTTSADVEEFFVEHRHKRLDFILLSASMETMMAKPIILMAGLVIRLKRLYSLGADFAYYRAVFDDLRSPKVSGSFRWYKKSGFLTYKSHTMAEGNTEAARHGGGNILFSKQFVMLYLFIIGAVYFFTTQRVNFNPMKPSKPALISASASAVPPILPVSSVGSPPRSPLDVPTLPPPPNASNVSATPPVPPPPPQIKLPYPRDMVIHVTGISTSKDRPDWRYYQFTAEVGSDRPYITQSGLIRAGYVIDGIHNCLVKLTHHDDPAFVQYAYCLSNDHPNNLKHEFSADGRTTQVITPPSSPAQPAQSQPLNFARY